MRGSLRGAQPLLENLFTLFLEEEGRVMVKTKILNSNF
jgi:hypothetical protein